MSKPGPGTLPQVLGPVEAFCVVVGSVIGSGIFMIPADVARAVPAIGPIALVWIVGGLFSAAGALTLAELGAMLPQAGGPYVYLREAYGRLPAFLFGWAEFLIVRAGSMATLAAAFARYFSNLVPPPGGLTRAVWQACAAIAAIAVVTMINVLGTALGGRVQVAGTVLKVGGVLTLIALPFVVGGGDLARLSPAWPEAFSKNLLNGMMVAMVGVLWAYDGWVNLTPLAEEVKHPGRDIPIALIGGMATLIGLYLAMTFAYHYVLTLPEVAASVGTVADKAVAGAYCHRLLGSRGLWAISLLVMASTFISLNGNALTGPRAYFAMARDGLFFRGLCTIHARYRTPANAVIAQGVWASALMILGTALLVAPVPGVEAGLPVAVRAAWLKLHQTPLYTVLYTYVIFGANVFYLLAIASVFVLRVRRPDAPRPYRTWGYPVTPALYVVASLGLLAHMLREKPVESVAGLAIIGLGLPAFWCFRRGADRRPSPLSPDPDGVT